MKINKPKNLDEYRKWLDDFLKIKIDKRTETHYESIANKIKLDFGSSRLWHDLNSKLVDFNSTYLLNSGGYQLFINEFKPTLVTKSFSSFFEKSFRKNIVLNKNWIAIDKPNPPDGGWITPDNWIERTNDILRTFFVVKYLDGVDFLMNSISELCRSNSLECNSDFEARDEGYYAVHLYTKCDFEIPKMSWDTERKTITIELQITTQLQDVISKLTHKNYENRRVRVDKENKKWQWDYQSEEFIPNYLGHILHYIEGMIMEVRQKQNNK
jgi:ppGpp synthetase/RelA/SpoT-type nucleotidyltranferase